MAESIIEMQRRLHEERESLEVAASDILLKINDKTNGMGRKETIVAENMVKYFLEGVQERGNQLYDIYTDEGRERAKEIQALGGPNEFSEFYTRLSEISREYRAQPGLVITPVDITHSKEQDGYINGKPLVMFTDEEQYGACLDLNENYKQYLNCGLFEKTDYIRYLSLFDKFDNIPKQKKFNQAYQSYLDNLLTYLRDFFDRALPLRNMSVEEKDIAAEFETKWQDGTCVGWEFTGESAGSDLYCKPCGKTFTNQNVYANHLNGKKHKKAVQNEAGSTESKSANGDKEKNMAKQEHSIARLAALLEDQREETRTSVQRKQARTAEELEEDQDVFEADSDGEEDEEDDKAPYNPKNLPLGWDGKPIPYWLYKLHGLNINYTCEICGGAAYKGPKAFQRHFQEAKHAHGMRQIGVPNTSHFINVTTKADAEALYAKLQAEKQLKAFKAGDDEEYEDSLGNVISKRIYMDLKANGLL
eukprot:CFRG7067T1